MTYEVIQASDEWIVLQGGIEIGRHHRQAAALDDVAERMRTRDQDDTVEPASFQRQATGR